MNKLKHMQNDPDFLDSEEKDIIESLNAAIDAGEFLPSQEKEVDGKKTFWKQVVKNTEKRRAITLRLQARDIERLKALARRKGLPYQTYIASALHQLANGDLVER